MKHLAYVILLSMTCKCYAQKDSLSYIIPDDYPITNEMLNHKEWLMQKGVTAGDKIWLRTADTSQLLIMDMYTDGHRLHIFHLQANIVPDDAYKLIEMNYSNGELATVEEVKDLMPAFINKATTIDAKYFKSKKGVLLGISTLEALKLYGKPDTLIDNDIDKYIWVYSGDITPDILPTNKKVRAKSSFGYKVEMYFKDDKLIAQVLTNEIP